MIVYIFNENYLQEIKLPIKVNGMYPIYDDDKLIANITSKNSTWTIQLSKDFMSSNIDNEEKTMQPYVIYQLSSIYGNSHFNIISIPTFDNNLLKYNIHNDITIGNNSSCTIYYPYSDSVKNGNEVIKLCSFANDFSFRLIETNSVNCFMSGKRVKTGDFIHCGDFLFFYGLKLIFLGSCIAINNPNGKVKIKFDNLEARQADIPFTLPKENANGSSNEKPFYNRDDYFFKSPRFNYIIENEVINIDAPPKKEKLDDTPIILSIGPQLTMVCTSVLSMIGFLGFYMSGTGSTLRLIVSISTMLVTIIGAILWPSITRKLNIKRIKKQEQQRQIKYTQYLEKMKQQINSIKMNQMEKLNKNHPTDDECNKIILSKAKELWQRNIDQDDFLLLRVGIGTTKTKLQINVPKQEFSIDDSDDLFIKMNDVATQSLNISNVPICYSFTKKNINGIIGNLSELKEFMDCLFLQMITFHSFIDLKLVVYTKNPQNWDYLKIIPHCWNNKKSKRFFATNLEELSTICSDLEKVFDGRVLDKDDQKKEDDGSKDTIIDYKDFKPYYLFFIDDMSSVRNVSLISKILHYKRNMGFSIIVASDNISTLPSETNDFIILNGNEGTVMSSNIDDNQTKFIPDYNRNNHIDLYKSAQKLANIPMVVDKEKYELPVSLTFLELYNLGRVEQLNSLSRWSDNNPVNNLSVPIGIDQNGELFKMDIHEKAYGPHGLVAGTTGSGKSEWIVTLILSLAVNFSPEEVQFVLIDYKGGGLAKSFENSELGIKLPHLAGTITNLDKSDIYRSMVAIESELKRRQTIFNAAREKLKEGSMNIYKYQQYYRKGLVIEPLSHLLIICDEFAELKQQQPEFMDELISTSRIGRSLGIHLILATQKPSGIVNDQIWSNSKFKVCLKVQDKSDSNEVLKKPDAAFLKQTGAFYLQVGNDDYYNLGQAAWAGARYYPSDNIKHEIDDSIDKINDIGEIIDKYEEKVTNNVQCEGEELLNIVAYLSNITKTLQLKNKPLWLENINPRILLQDLFKKYHRVKPDYYKYNVVIGEYDEPRKQMQGVLELNLSEGNIGIIGQNGSGIDNLISTIIFSSICEHTPYEIAYYIIDFGAETLKKFAKFPHVGEVSFQDDMDKVAGILDLIIEEVDKRKELLSDYNGSFEYYNKVSDKKLPLIILVINNFDVFEELLSKLDNVITDLFRDAPKYGVIFIVSSVSTAALRQHQLQYFNHLILMQLTDDSMYRSLCNCRRELIPKKVNGRGICKVDSRDNDSYCEFQTAMIANEENEINTIKDFADKCVSYYKYKVKQLAKIPDNVSSNDLVKYINTLEQVPIGYNFYEKDIAKFNLLTQRIFFISGKSINQNVKFIYGLTSVLSKISNVKIRIIDMMDIFKKPILDIKIFNDNFDVVFAALEKDLLTRTETQDYGINIILGVAQFKKRLSKGGIEIFRNIFEKLPNSKKCIYLLIDDYEQIRMLKLESWFKEEYVNNGIWLGTGFSNQSIFEINDIKDEDKKYDFEGIAINIENKNYKVIKTVMDEDD